MRVGGRALAAIVGAAYLVLIVAWVFSNPPGASPDEGFHLVKAVGLVHLEVGSPVPVNPDSRLHHVQAQTRDVDVPRGLAPDPYNFGCNAGGPDPASCLTNPVTPPPARVAPTVVGTYQPYLYIAPGLATLPFHSAPSALYAARLINALLASALIGAAALLLLDRKRVSPIAIVGLVVAITPMVVFVASGVSASGPEVASAVCFFAGLLRVFDFEQPRPWMWIATGVAGGTLALARELSIVWVVIGVIAVVASVGLRQTLINLIAGLRWAVAAAGIITCAAVANLAWEMLVQPSADIPLRKWLFGVDKSFDQLYRLAGEFVGNFGSLDTGMPQAVYIGWAVLVGVLVLTALAVGTARGRAALFFAAFAVFASMLVTDSFQREFGFGAQGRHVLPLAVLVPLLAADIVRRRRLDSGLVGRALCAVAIAAVGAGQLVGWWSNARKSAVGASGPVWFAQPSAWAPPLGWGPWFVLAAGGLVLLWLSAAGVAGASAPGRQAAAVPRRVPSGRGRPRPASALQRVEWA